jgi:hypothetical protein
MKNLPMRMVKSTDVSQQNLGESVYTMLRFHIYNLSRVMVYKRYIYKSILIHPDDGARSDPLEVLLYL